MFKFCLACFYCLIASAPAAFVIDDFTTPQTLTGGIGGTASGSGIVGGERDAKMYQQSAEIHINSTYGNGCRIINTAGGNQSGYAYLTYDGPDGSITNYDTSGLGHVDLTGGGQYDGFQITFSQMDAVGGSMLISLFQGEDRYGQIFFDMPAQPQSIFLPFADFDMNMPASESSDPVPADLFIDFTNVGYIHLWICLAPGGSCTIDSITTVPEPATLTLLAMGGLLLSRRKA